MSVEYHKIQSIYKRWTPERIAEAKEAGVDITTIKKGSFIVGEYTLPEFEMLKDITWQFTEKVDGTNIRLSLIPTPAIGEDGLPKVNDFGEIIEASGDHELYIEGRTSRAQIPVNLTQAIHNLLPISKFKEVFSQNPEHVTLYGEGYGARIQKGGGDYIPDGVSFILFDVRVGHTWLRRDSVEAIGNELGLKVVPIAGEGTLEDGIRMCTEGFESQLRSTPPEGIIAKPKHELLDRRGKRIITKIKLCDFQ